MTHMHIPDGILPVWLWLSGFILMSLVLGYALYRLRTMDTRKKIPLLGAVAAAMLVGMSIPILPGYHINLSVVSGILMGPSLGLVAAFIANLILAFMGHGGITVIGLNTLLLGSEAVLGHAFFYLLRDRLPIFWRAAFATVLTLCISSAILIGFVAMAHIDPAMLHHGEDHGHIPTMRGSVATFAVLVFTIGIVGWLVEAAITGAVVKFISQVKPDLLGHVLHKNKDGLVQ
jgi:cobalt/nickel transport system permease protein